MWVSDILCCKIRLLFFYVEWITFDIKTVNCNFIAFEYEMKNEAETCTHHHRAAIS